MTENVRTEGLCPYFDTEERMKSLQTAFASEGVVQNKVGEGGLYSDKYDVYSKFAGIIKWLPLDATTLNNIAIENFKGLQRAPALGSVHGSKLTQIRGWD